MSTRRRMIEALRAIAGTGLGWTVDDAANARRRELERSGSPLDGPLYLFEVERVERVARVARDRVDAFSAHAVVVAPTGPPAKYACAADAAVSAFELELRLARAAAVVNGRWNALDPEDA